MEPPFISMILPTRCRVKLLQQFLRSIMIHSDHPGQLEIILVVDDDDRETIEFDFPYLRIKKQIVQPGQSMGALNQAGFAVSSGHYLMLVNDDIVIQTDHWDRTLRSALDHRKDNVILAHVNDLVFQHRLSIFPIVSRQYCEIAKGICPTGFSRYRIDNHIFSTFRMAAILGAHPIIFFPFVIFNHLNYIVKSGRRTYLTNPGINPEIEAQDDIIFWKLYEERLSVAIELCRRNGIEPSVKAIHKLKRTKNSYHYASWPSRVYLGRPNLQEFSLALRMAFQQINYRK